ncbi:MAG: flagellar hook basal-body protein [Sulfuricella sp.]|nr:flagellar hook basal-body protein [Sulfuricella sp.]
MNFSTIISGLSQSTRKLDLIGNNIANTSTVGFKQTMSKCSDFSGVGGVGMGVMPTTTVQEFNQGEIKLTENPLDMAINGNGFFQVKISDGSLAYTRNGQFHLDKSGYVVTDNGEQLMGTSGPIKIDPAVLGNFKIDANGVISSINKDGSAQTIATVGLFSFRNPQGLESIGNNLWQVSPASGAMVSGAPNTKGLGLLQSSAVEASVVDLNVNLVNLIIAQREYQSNAQGLKILDEMQQRLISM